MKKSEFMSAVRGIPCVLCEHLGLGETPSEAHHLFDADRRSDWLLAALCAEHHRGKTGVHMLKRRGFERRYKLSDEDLLAMTLEQLMRTL